MPDPLYVAARRVLLDSLQALGPHLGSVVLAGAQAVYLHTGEGDLAVAPFTTDGDLVIDPRSLADAPLLAEALTGAGFRADPQPGRWIRDGFPVDFLVPEALGGRRGRGAELGRHGTRFARQVRGLEGAVVDSSMMRLSALDEGDAREFKLGERLGHRERDKDALDVFRLLRVVPAEALAVGLRRLLESRIAGGVTQDAMALLSEHFGASAGRGNDMLVRAVAGLEPEAELRASCAALAGDLLKALEAPAAGKAPTKA